MGGFLAGLGKVLGGIAKGVGSAVKGAAKMAHGATKIAHGARNLSRYWKLLVAGIVAVLVFPLLFVAVAVGGVITAVNGVFTSLNNIVFGGDFTQEEINQILNDAGLLHMYLEEVQFELPTDDMYFIDVETIKRILAAVDEYNKTVSIMHGPIDYQYSYEQGLMEEFPDVDYTTGVFLEEKPKDSYTYKSEYKWHSDYEGANIRRMDIEGEGRRFAEGGQDLFYMRWQPVFVLSCMYIQATGSEWGTYGDYEDKQEKGYYLSDAEIDAIIDVFSYEYDYYADLTVSKNYTIEFEEFENGCTGYQTKIQTNFLEEQEFDVEVDSVDASGKPIKTKVKKKLPIYERIVERIPTIAPVKISNSYISYDYHYTDLGGDVKILDERRYTIAPAKFVEACESFVKGFQPYLFTYLIGKLPCTEDLVTYYKDVLFPMAKVDGTITGSDNATYDGHMWSASDTTKAYLPVVLTVVYTGGDEFLPNGVGASGSVEYTGEGFYIPLYACDGWNGIYLKPADFLVEEGGTYGRFFVSNAANTTLTVSDNLNFTQVYRLISTHSYFVSKQSSSPLLRTEQARRDMAQALIDFQTDTGASLTGILGLIKQEGGYSSRYAREGYNYINWTSGDKSKQISGTRFRNYKVEKDVVNGKYETAAVNALYMQMMQIYDNYWTRAGGAQDTYYAMIFNGYNAGDSASAYTSISHSYCPPWEDPAMPYSADSNYNGTYYWKGVNSSYKGWCNRCGEYRLDFLEYAK